MNFRLQILIRRLVLAFLPIFVLGAIYFNWDQGPFHFDGPFAFMKLLVWISFALFSAYSGYCTLNEDLFGTLREVMRFHFGRQICIDLYLGVGLILFLMYLNEPTFLGFLVWMIPTLFYVNLISLLYFAIHFDHIVMRLLNL